MAMARNKLIALADFGLVVASDAKGWAGGRGRSVEGRLGSFFCRRGTQPDRNLMLLKRGVFPS
jgi:hypothetical protein